MAIGEEVWDFFQQHMGYDEEEMEIFRQNPRNEDVISKAPALMNKTIIAEVVESHGCNSGHKVGDRFIFDGAGNLITSLCPKRICIFALPQIATGIFTGHELFYAGADPNEARFNRAGCLDVGVNCGGWGRVIFELRVEDREKSQ